MAIAYHPSAGSGEFLLAWQQAYAAPQPDVFVRRVDGGGQPAGDSINVTSHPAAQKRPFLATGTGGYLTVWQDTRDGATSGSDVYGHLLDGSGALSGTLIAISSATGDQFNPAAAYNSRRNEYLVVWDDYRNSTNRDIYGQVVGSDGALVAGAAFSLTVTGYQGYPDVAYDPDRDRYLAVWEDDQPGTPGTDIYGQVISADGSLLGSDFALSSASGYQYDPVLAYGQASEVYLAAWWDRRDDVQYDIFGQVDPLFWRDQAEDTGDRDDFETLWAGDSRALGSSYSGSSPVYSHYAVPGWASWQDYEYSGRLKMDDADSGIGKVSTAIRSPHSYRQEKYQLPLSYLST